MRSEVEIRKRIKADRATIDRNTVTPAKCSECGQHLGV
jgi:hypothetical protein